ncbi:gas vesicle protein K [Rubrimonas cliftonensis]|uniref:Gas vesicle protein K n=1 Tax=Rubrimonas cliftonensis TaxID=89524 RepID=A0A1H4ALR4_9RHOB|nr:gas vesicle protein K [Rubrimonas cliftonensis]SEA36825.1 Gas vesicle protein K [Rubrimonas cliftonensis]
MSGARATMALDAEDCAAAVEALLASAPDGRVALSPETVERDLARLVLGLMEFIRKLMELQAIRRMEAGALTPEEEARVGETLMRAAAALRDLAGRFGLEEADLSLDLGALGRLS